MAIPYRPSGLHRAADSDQQPGDEGMAAQEVEGGNTEGDRDRLVVGTDHDRPDQHRVQDRKPDHPGLQLPVTTSQADGQGAGDDHEGHADQLQPEDDIVHGVPAEPVGADLDPVEDRPVDARGVLPGALGPTQDRVVLGTEESTRGDRIGTHPEYGDPAVGRIHQHIGRGQRRYGDGQGTDGDTEEEAATQPRQPARRQRPKTDPHATGAEDDRQPGGGGDHPLVAQCRRSVDVPRREQTAVARPRSRVTMEGPRKPIAR